MTKGATGVDDDSVDVCPLTVAERNQVGRPIRHRSISAGGCGREADLAGRVYRYGLGIAVLGGIEVIQQSVGVGRLAEVGVAHAGIQPVAVTLTV